MKTSEVKPTVLIVDDCSDTLTLLKFMFESLDATVYTANSGPEALALMVDKGARTFDLVMLDIRMPEMQGTDLAPKIRELSFDGKIIGLTAAASGHGRELSLKSGINVYLGKDTLKREVAHSLVMEARQHLGKR